MLCVSGMNRHVHAEHLRRRQLRSEVPSSQPPQSLIPTLAITTSVVPPPMTQPDLVSVSAQVSLVPSSDEQCTVPDPAPQEADASSTTATSPVLLPNLSPAPPRRNPPRKRKAPVRLDL